MATLILVLFTLLLSSLFSFLIFFRKKSGNSDDLPLPPGPKGWPVLGNLPQLGAKPHQTLHALSKQYGPLFRLRFGSVDVIVVASGAVAVQFLRTHDVNFSSRPPTSGAEHVAYNYQDLVFAPYGPRWRMLRKICALHLFSAKALDDLRQVREGEVAILVRTLNMHGNSRKGAVNLGSALNICTTNALSMALIGRRVFGDEEAAQGKADEFKEMVAELMRLGGVFNIGDFVPWLSWLDLQGVVGNMKRLHRRFDAFLSKVIAEHEVKAGRESEEDLLSVLIGLKKEGGEGGSFTNTDIKALLLNLFTAGTDTSSSTVEWAITELIRHPDILKKCQDELDSVVGRDRLATESDIPNLPLLQAIVKENFRLHPATPLSIPRIASEECTINGRRIPKNASVLVNIWAIARDPAAWSDPLEFRPGRFLPEGDNEHVDVKGNDFDLIPFGAGRRICAGMSLGIRMIQFMTATLVHAFDWTLPPGLEAEKLDMEEAFGLTLRKDVPLMVQPVPRLAKQAYESPPF